jgi:uncharacterized tellurite resistance protein B-like protein
MSRKRLLLTLAKLLTAAAWVDGELTREEINNLKDLLFRLRDLTASDWAELEIYMDSPVEAAERERLVTELQDLLSSKREKSLAIRTLRETIEADGVVTPEEEQVVEEIVEVIEASSVGVIAKFGRLLSGPMQRREQAMSAAINREAHLDDFVRNRVFYALRRQEDHLDQVFDLTEAEIRKLSLAGGLLSRVAHAHEGVSEVEREAIVEVLQERWDLDREGASLVAQVAESEIPKSLDDFRLRREFFNVTSRKERRRFLDTLFAIAAVDGEVSNEEVEEIRSIAHALKLTHRAFIRAKVQAKP